LKHFLITISILFVTSGLILAQKQNNIWYFGTNAGLDFNTSSPTPLVGEMFALEGCASVSDPGGHLLFYTNGVMVWNRNHNVMPNGNGLEGDEGSTQAALIVPLPNSNSKYYIFTIDEFSKNGNLYYSIVDMNLNGGYGDIVTGSKNIFVVTRVAENMTSVLHTNGVDIWIVTHKSNSTQFLSYLLSSTGLDPIPVVSSIGSSHLAFELSGTIKASHDGSKIASSYTDQDFDYNVAELFDFNTTSGEVSNLYDLEQLIPSDRWVYGIEFSPNDSLLYLSTNVVGGYLYQIDLETKQLTTLSTNKGADYGALQLGPDNKIYMARYGFQFLDVIHQPDKQGVACQYEEAGISLATNTLSALGLPAFVPYSFYPDSIAILSLGSDTSICAGSSITLSVDFTASCDSIHFLWNDGSTGQELVVHPPGVYWIEIESSCSTFRDTIQIDTITCQSACGNVTATLYGNQERNERGYCLAPTAEKDGFYIGGYSEGRATITKMALNGYVYWARSFNIVPAKEDHINSMLVDAEGMLVVSGTSLAVNGSGSCFVMRYDPNNDLVLWSKEYSNGTYIENYSIIEKGNTGNYLVSNYSADLNLASGFQILELDKQNGNLQFAQFHSPGGGDTVAIITDFICVDENIYGAGFYGSYGPFSARNRNLLIKMDAENMDLIWSNLGHYAPEATADLRGCDLIMINHEIYSCYYGRPPGSFMDKIYIQKTDLDGNLIWLKQYDILKPRIVGFEMIHSDNGIVVLATQLSNLNEITLFKVDYEGVILWARKFRSGLFSRNILDNMDKRSSQLIEVGENLVFTTYAIDSLGKENLVLIKTDLNGESNLPCVDNLVLSLQWRDVNNPVFYPLDLTSTEIELNETTVFSQRIAFDLNLLESCTSPDTIFSTLDITICAGEIFEGHGTTGVFTDAFTLSSGCDSIRTLRLNVISCSPIVYYDLDACESVMSNGSHMDYTEFTPAYPATLACADVSAHYLYRDQPQMNKHSCTPGINNSPAMCVTTLNSCEYQPGNGASVVIEFTINPSPDSVVQITGLEFFEKGPATYNWTNGPTGPNNYPQYYAIRILKNGVEIYRRENISTTPAWTLQSYDFLNDTLFKIEDNTTFRIELLSYCPIGNGAEVSAWDIDEIKIYGGCVPILPEQPVIHGNVFTKEGKAISNTNIYLSDNADFSGAKRKLTNVEGYYLFDHLKEGTNGYLKGYKNDDVMNGVSTLDLIRIQKHLLGISSFTSLHQYVAADVNRNGNVSVTDLLDLRKLILGIYSEFPDNTSWRFGPLPQDMSGTDLSTFQETKNLEFIANDTQVVNFIGIKVGDVNESIQSPFHEGNVAIRNDKDLKLRIDDQQIKQDVPFTIELKMNERVNIAGMQLSFLFKDLELISVDEAGIPITEENYSLTSDGVFRLSWSQSESIEIDDDEILLRFTLVSHHPGSLAGRIQLAQEILTPEAYGDDDESYKFRLEIGNPIVSTSGISFFEVIPNPLQSFANIHFNLIAGGKTLIRFYDVSGRMIYEMNKAYAAGEHFEQIRSSDLINGDGVIFCQLICNGDTKVVRVVKLLSSE